MNVNKDLEIERKDIENKLKILNKLDSKYLNVSSLGWIKTSVIKRGLEDRLSNINHLLKGRHS